MTRAILLDANGCKPCPKCKEVKHFSLFSVRRNTYASWCKACHVVAAKISTEANSDEVKRRQRQRYLNNKEKVSRQGKAWRAANVERRRAIDKAYKLSTPESVKAKRAQASEKLPDYFVRHRLKLTKGEHPQEDLLIAMKREALSLKRATRAAKTQLKETP